MARAGCSFLLGLLFLAAPSCPVFGAAGEFTIVQGNTDGEDLLVFSGRIKSFQGGVDVCEGDPKCMSFDARYEASYDVIATVKGGERLGDTVKFSVFVHSGPVGVPESPAAVLFVWKHPSGNVMLKYSGVAIFPTIDGRWISCGDPYPEGTPAQDRRLHAAILDRATYDAMLKQARSNGTFSADYVIAEFPEDCAPGAYVEEFAPALARQYELASRQDRQRDEHNQQQKH